MNVKELARKKKKKEEEGEEPEDDKGATLDLIGALAPLLARGGDTRDEFRVTGIYGTLTEERCMEAIYSLYALRASGREIVLEDPDDPKSNLIEAYKPIQFLLSTYGGSAADMFAVYDVMREVQLSCDVVTHGHGKVMSAGVLLLAAGTKGQRVIGSNCRVMIHGVISGQHGNLFDVENEFEEAKTTQEKYIKALVRETNMKQTYIKKLLQRKTNVYLSAQESVELGIADIIV